MLSIISWCVFGLIVGALARLFVPGQDRLGCLGTIALGVVGSIVGGYIAAAVAGNPLSEAHAANLLLSVVGAIVVLLIAHGVERRV